MTVFANKQHQPDRPDANTSVGDVTGDEIPRDTLESCDTSLTGFTDSKSQNFEIRVKILLKIIKFSSFSMQKS